MNIAKNNLLFLLLLLQISSASAGTVSKECFEYSNGKLVVHLLKEDLNRSRKQLENVSHGDIPSGAKGGVLFDGKVLKRLPNDQYGQPAWIVQPEKIYLGAEQIPALTIKLHSPTLANGGVLLSPGNSYRLLAVNVGNLWKGKSTGLFVWGAALKLGKHSRTRSTQ